MVQTSAVDRVVLEGSANRLNTFSNQWPNYAPAYTTPPLGLINVYVGNSPTNSNLVASYMELPYDAGNPVGDRSRYYSVQSSARALCAHCLADAGLLGIAGTLAWICDQRPSQPAPATNMNLNIGEIELYGISSGANARSHCGCGGRERQMRRLRWHWQQVI